MGSDRFGRAYWPGAMSFTSLSYAVSHGISPAVAAFSMNPQDQLPASSGDLRITDDVNSVVLRNCRVKNVLVQGSADSGFTWTLMIEDRRRTWSTDNPIGAWFNQRDPHSKLLPWDVRSPREIVDLILESAGERADYIDLPDGLEQADGQRFRDVFRPGEDLDDSQGTNPPVDWSAVPAMVALQQFVELLGRRVVWNPLTDNVSIVVAGVGGQIRTTGPGLSVRALAPAIAVAPIPKLIRIAGVPDRYQARLLLEPVGIDWDFSIRAIADLTYAPLGPDGKADWGKDLGMNNVRATINLTRFQAVELARRSVWRMFRIVGGNEVMIPVSLIPSFDASGREVAGPARRFIQIMGYDGEPERFRIILSDSQTEQTIPESGDGTRFDTNGDPVFRAIYDGYSKDRRAEIYGSAVYSQSVSGWSIQHQDKQTTPPGKPYSDGFSVDAEQQTVTFNRQVYYPIRFAGPMGVPSARYGRPYLFLQCAVEIRDDLGNQRIRTTFDYSTSTFPGTGLPDDQSGSILYEHDDIQVDYDAVWNDNFDPIFAGSNEADFAEPRAKAYATAHAATMVVSTGITVDYNGIEVVTLDGAIQQVSWRIDIGKGCETTISRNAEHEPYVPKYPRRRREENIPPVQRARNFRGDFV